MPDRTETERYGEGRSAVASAPEIEQLRDEVRRLREEQQRMQAGDASPTTPPVQTPEQQAAPPQAKPREDKRPVEEKSRGFIREHPVKALIGLMVLVFVIAAALWYWSYSSQFEETDDAQIDGHLNAVSTRIAGTITAVHVQENQEVKAGQLLVELDPRDYQVELERSQANVAQAQAQARAQQPAVPIASTSARTGPAAAQAELAAARAGLAAAEQQYQSQVARIAQAEANNAKAQSDLQRYNTLVQKDEVSRQDYDQRVASAKSAAATVESERAGAAAAQGVIEQRRSNISQAEARLNEVVANAPQEISIQRANVALRNASVEAAQAAVAQGRLNLEYTKIYAPVSGVIGRKAAEVGMRVAPGQQLMALVPLNDIWVTANYKENQLKGMRVKQRVTIHVDALDRDFDGYVESMPAATAARYSILPPENASGNYVKVVQRLPVRLRFKDPESAHGALRPGMSVVPKVWMK